MRTLNIGYSDTLTAAEIRDMIQVRRHEDAPTELETLFGAGYIDAGGYEVYGVGEDAVQDFTPATLRLLFPFSAPASASILNRDLSEAKSVFFIEDEAEWTVREAGGLVVTDRITIDDYE